MDTSKAKKQEKKGSDPATSEKKPLEITSSAVQNVRVVEGRNGDIVFFTLMLNGIMIYNCRVATGKNGDFVSYPQYKGSDNKWYNSVYAYLKEEDQKMILDEIQEQINAMTE